ncbi:MAG: class I SAM-dependent methyltransferase [Bacteroidota bacterium]
MNLKILKKFWLLNFLRRLAQASMYYNGKYAQILSWGIHSKEDTNYTYDISDKNICYLAHTIAVATNTNYQPILQYINEAKEDVSLRNSIIEATKSSPFRKYADLEVRLGKRLGWYAFVRVLKPKVVVETGVDKGLGSVVICAALFKNKEEGYDGQYYGTDINPKAGYLLTGKYQEVGKILYGDSINSLSQFSEKIDLFINDSDHSADYEYQEYLAIQQLLSNKAIILGDNAHVTDKLLRFSNETSRRFLFFKEDPVNHWYPGGGIGISFK